MIDEIHGTKPKVAYLGMGIMGASMAVNLVKAGFNVHVWNRTADSVGLKKAVNAGAVRHTAIEAAVKDADFILSCLGDIPDVQEVLLGASGAACFTKPGALFIDFTTIGPDAARTISNQLSKCGCSFLDAPVTGGDIGAREGTLTILVGGLQSDFDRVLPILEAVGKAIWLCGPVGAGQAVKLCNQILTAINMIGVSEAMVFAEELGVDPRAIVEKLSGGAGGSWVLSNLGPRILASDYRPGFTLQHMIKDLRLIEENRAQAELPFPGVELAKHLFETASKLNTKDGSSLGTQTMIKAYRKD